MKQGGSKEGGRKRPRRSGWEEDDDYVEEERDIEYGSWNRNIYHASIIKTMEHIVHCLVSLSSFFADCNSNL